MMRNVTWAVLLAASVAGADGIEWETALLPGEAAWTFSIAENMNDGADVVGRYAVGTERHAVLWEHGSSTYVDIASAFGGLPAGFVNSFAQAINDSGLIGGTVADGALVAGTKQEAIIWDRATMTGTVVHPGALGYDSSRISGLTEGGLAVGHVINLVGPPPDPRAYVWDVSDLGAVTGRLLPLPVGLTTSFALDVNESNWVAGFAGAGPVSHAVVWAPDDSIEDLHDRLVAAEGAIAWSRAFGISDEGVATGVAFNATFTERFAWTWDRNTGVVTILDRGGEDLAVAADIAGPFVVGSIGPFQDSLAAVWIDGDLHRLETLAGFRGMAAGHVNADGFVSGRVFEQDGSTRAYLAEPIPEPGTLALLLGGLAMAAVAVRRRRRRS